MQSDSPLSQQPQVQPPVMGAVQPPRKFNMAAIILAVFLCLFLMVSAGLGYRAFQLRNELEAARASLSDLQGRHDSLMNEKQALDGELAGVNAELETTQSELSSTQATLATVSADLAASEQIVATLTDKMERAGSYMQVMHNWFDDSNQDTIAKARNTGDDQLVDLLTTLLDNFTNSNYLKFIKYLLTTVVDILDE